jgi:hypothetical protein
VSTTQVIPTCSINAYTTDLFGVSRQVDTTLGRVAGYLNGSARLQLSDINDLALQQS